MLRQHRQDAADKLPTAPATHTFATLYHWTRAGGKDIFSGHACDTPRLYSPTPLACAVLWWHLPCFYTPKHPLGATWQIF